jgi:hypothetical protein
MKTDSYLTSRKKEYKAIHVSQKQIDEQWLEFLPKIKSKNKPIQKYFRFASVVSLIILTAGTTLAFQKSKNSKPGEIFYPLKKLTGQTKVAVDSNPEKTSTPKPIKDEIKSQEVEITPTPEIKDTESTNSAESSQSAKPIKYQINEKINQKDDEEKLQKNLEQNLKNKEKHSSGLLRKIFLFERNSPKQK